MSQLNLYLKLIRFDKPIGTLLLLWPTLTALFIASKGWPSAWLIFVFICGTFLARSAGCVINDFFDRQFDLHVERTKDRPIASGLIKPRSALCFCSLLFLIAFMLVLTLNKLTVAMAILAFFLACLYPLMKRITQIPQIWLGVAFNWGILMAFTAVRGKISLEAVLLYIAVLLLTVAYDTQYAMVDREDDLKIGIKSTAILFGRCDRMAIFTLQMTGLALLVLMGIHLGLASGFYVGVVAALLTFIYQNRLLKDRLPEKCFQAFLNNQWTLLFIFLGVLLSVL